MSRPAIAAALLLLAAAAASAQPCDLGFRTPDRVADVFLGAGEGAVFGDVNGDGLADIVIERSNDFGVLLNRGNGAFEPFPYVNGGAGRIVDANGDGYGDLIAFNQMLLSNGDGTFRAASRPSGITGFPILAVADMNGDGRPDIVAEQASALGADVLLSNGDGTFRKWGSIPPPSGTLNTLAVGDFDGDGNMDIARLEASGAAGDQYVLFFFGNGAGTFTNVPNASYTFDRNVSRPASLLATDLNGDGVQEVVAVTDSTLYIIRHDRGRKVSAEKQAFPPFQGYGMDAKPIGVADLDRDGHPDLVVQSPYVLVILWGGADGRFTPSFFQPGGLLSLADMNGDGAVDLVMSGSHGIRVVYAQNGRDLPLEHVVSPAFGIGGVQTLADVNGDGVPDFIIGSGYQIGVAASQPDGSFSTPVPVAFATSGLVVQQLFAGDFDGDGMVDVAIARGTSFDAAPSIDVLFGNGTVTFTAAPGLHVDNARLWGTGKVDGHDALVVTTNGAAQFVTLSGRHPVFGPSYATTGSVLPADVDADGATELLLNETAGCKIVKLAADGWHLVTTVTGRVLDVGDVDGDGRPDLLVDLISGGPQVAINNGNGYDAVERLLQFNVGETATQFRDMDGDGRAEIVINSDASYLRVMHRRGRNDYVTTLVPFGEDTAPSVVGIADMNRDGVPDLISVRKFAESGCARSRLAVAALTPAVPTGGSARLVFSGFPADTLNPSPTFVVTDGGKEVARIQLRYATATTWTSGPLTVGTHVFTVTMTDPTDGTNWQQTVTVTAGGVKHGRAVRQ